MAATCVTVATEEWIRERLQLKHPHLGNVRSLSLPGTKDDRIGSLGSSLVNFVRLKSLDLSYNALVCVEGVQHLMKLERLILYSNCILSLEEVKLLFELPVLRELDLRLNPLTKHHPHYRPCLVHAMPNLHMLDRRFIGDAERKAALMQFSSADLPQVRNLAQVSNQRSSDQRLASLERLTKRRSLPADTSDIVLNFVPVSRGDPNDSPSLSGSPQTEPEEPLFTLRRRGTLRHGHEPRVEKMEDYAQLRSSTPTQERAKSILRSPSTIHTDNMESKGRHINEPHYKKIPSEVAERPRVSFGPYVEKHTSGNQKETGFSKQTQHTARGHFTPNPDYSRQCRPGSPYIHIRPPSPRKPGLNLSDPSNPILHPPRLTYSASNQTEGGSSMPQHKEKNKRGSYRKPLEMLLNLVDKYWVGERSLHHNNNFLSHAIEILSMMESDISSWEAEVTTLRQEVDTLNFQMAAREEAHAAKVRDLSAQLDGSRSAVGKLNGQLKTVLEENVDLQKQLIKLERQYLKSMMKSSPSCKIKEAQTEVDELSREVQGLRRKLQDVERVKESGSKMQENHRSWVAT